MLGALFAVATNTALDKLHDEDVKVNRFRQRPGSVQSGKAVIVAKECRFEF